MAKPTGPFMQCHWIEVVPAPVISPLRPSSSVPRLETIVEEVGGQNKLMFHLPNKALFLVVLSLVSSVLISKYVTV